MENKAKAHRNPNSLLTLFLSIIYIELDHNNENDL